MEISDQKYRQILAKFIMKHGHPSPDNMYWGSSYADDYKEVQTHVRSCGYDIDALHEEFEWSTFAGTFTNHDDTQHGMHMIVTCTCDKYVKRSFIWEGRVVEAIRQVLEMIDV